MLRSLAAIALAAGAGVVGVTLPPVTAPAPGEGDVGADVSHPQCPIVPGPVLGLPDALAFAVVGVNDGVATRTNPCLTDELGWAAAATGGRPGGVQLYVNTADPGPSSSRWPRSDTPRGGNPYGPCAGDADLACAYGYGYRLATDDLARVPAAYGSIWWLDVEAANTWSADRDANRAVLEGMAAALREGGATPGVYANRTDWRTIIGAVPATSPLRDLPTWLAGATTRSGALENCGHATLTGGGRIMLTQYVSPLVTLDADVACGPVRPAG